MKSLRCFISSVGGGAASCDVVLSTSIRMVNTRLTKVMVMYEMRGLGSARV